MSKITLDPGEVFEHTHSAASTTTLVEGEIIVEIAGSTLQLQMGEPFAIEAGTAHRMINQTSRPAVAHCYYNPSNPPPSPENQTMTSRPQG